jgi:hypothetical protein
MITFKAELTEDDVKAMQGCFYQAMNESMEISEVWGLEIKEETGFDEEPDNNSIEDLHKYTMHIDDVEDGLYACKTISEVRDFLDSIPRKFGEWYVDIVMGLDGKAYYEVTNDYYEYGELQVKTYDLEIEVEEED